METEEPKAPWLGFMMVNSFDIVTKTKKEDIEAHLKTSISDSDWESFLESNVPELSGNFALHTVSRYFRMFRLYSK